jgi:hypothetical protein
MSPEAVGAAVLRLEHGFYWQVVKAFAEGQVQPTNAVSPESALHINPTWLAAMHASKSSP